MEPIPIPHIETRPGRSGDVRAYVAGTRVRVQDIASEHELHGLTPEQIAREHPQLSLAQVYAALAYYFDHRQEIRRQMKQDDEFVAAMEAAARGKSESKPSHGDSLSSR
jgi:uncharacterized protein (DUF433 family)